MLELRTDPSSPASGSGTGSGGPFDKRHQADRDSIFTDTSDGRLWLEKALLPPGMTFTRVVASGLFFVMLYAFVFTIWYIAVGGDTCSVERQAADRAEAEVLRLRAELSALLSAGASSFGGAAPGAAAPS
mmetsp:Transcript_67227/g.218922  ORF Transcript_67227/g.218922 Transcript_67227/m.218922 type:complete len:130 (+) Transcript_67227:197-586(+)